MRFSLPPPAALLAAALIVGAGLAAGVNLGTYRAIHAGTEQATRALIEMDNLLSDLRDAETGQRGYLLTGDEAYLRPYDRALASFDADLAQVVAAVGTTPGRRERLETIASLGRDKLAELERTVALQRGGDTAAAVALVRTDRGRRLMAAIREQVAALRAEIIARRAQDQRGERRLAAGSAITIFGAAALVALLLGAVAVLRGRAIERQGRSIEELLEEKADSEFDRLSALTLIDSLPMGVLVAGADGRIVRRNAAAMAIWGGSAAHPGSIAAGHPGYDGWRVENGQKLAPQDWALVQVLQTGESIVGEMIRIRRFDEGFTTILNSAAPIRGAGGRILGAVAVVQDVTAYQEEHERLALTEARYRAIVDTALDAIATIDEHGVVQSFNRAAERVFGYAAAEVAGRNIRMLMPEPIASEHDGYLARYIRTGDRHIIGIGREVTAQRKDGTTFPIELSVNEWFANGQRYFTGTMRDITEQKRVEEALRGSEQRFRSLFQESPVGKALVGVGGQILEANPALCRMLGYTADELTHRRFPELAHPEDRGKGTAEAEAVYAGERPRARFEKRYLTRTGETTWVSIHVGPVPGPDGRPLYAIAVIEDITERRRAEEALRESQVRLQQLQAEFLHVSRLSEIGQMAATLAHELNQPLAANANYLSASRRMLDGDRATANLPRVREALGLAAREAMRAGQIIRRMRSFVTRGEADKRIEDLARLVEEASELVLIQARQHRVAVHLDVDPSLPRVLADRVQVQQVLFNLMRNAVEAMETGERRELTVTAAATEDGTVEVAVADTGPGISPEIAADLFQPFVSTKQSGTGIGLSISRTIIEGHGGRIWVEPNPGGGTIFRFTLLAVPETEAAEAG